MTRSSDKSSQPKIIPFRSRKKDSTEAILRAQRQTGTEYLGMKLIPWNDVWTSLKTARTRGNGEMIQVFYETLFREALFDDRGAWSVEYRRLH
jgi:hypothetical protein